MYQTTETSRQLIEARRARLQRFAEAAARHQQTVAPPKPSLLMQPLVRSERHHIPARQRRETIDRRVPEPFICQRILQAIALEFGVTVGEIRGPRRHEPYCLARFFAVGLILEMTTMSLPAIGRRMSRDHATIIHARRKAKELFAQESIRNRVDQIKKEILG